MKTLQAGEMFADDLDVIFWFTNPTKYPRVPRQFRIRLCVGLMRAERVLVMTPECFDPCLTDGVYLRPCGEGEGEVFWLCVDGVAFCPENKGDEWEFRLYQDCEGITPRLIAPLTHPYDATRDEIPDYITWTELWLEVQARWGQDTRRPNGWRSLPRTFHPSHTGTTEC